MMTQGSIVQISFASLNFWKASTADLRSLFHANGSGADGGTRTHTSLSRKRILSPLRLPFRHIGGASADFKREAGARRKEITASWRAFSLS